MTLGVRRLLYAACIVIFLVVAPPLVLYTAGWRYDFNYRRLVSTGSLVIKSLPDAAAIKLNSQAQTVVTPAIINNILPGKINLEVAKEGYHPWQRTIAVAPRVTTFVENIKLFRQSAPALLVAGPAKQFWWNQKQDKMAYLSTSGELRLFNTLNAKDTHLANLGASPATVSWSPHDDQLLVNHQIIDANAPEKVINLDSILGQKFNNLKWDPVVPDTLYGLRGNALYRLPYRLQTAQLVVSGAVGDYYLERERMIWVEKHSTGRTASLTWMNLSDQNTVHSLLLRPEAATAVFIPTNARPIALHNAAKKILWVADLQMAGAVIEIPNAAKAIWTHDGSRLLYTDGAAIYQRAFSDAAPALPDEHATTLITRYSEPVTDIFWSDDELYLFYIIGSRLNVLETIPNFTPFSLELLNTGQILKQPEFIRNQLMVAYIDEGGALQSLPIAQKQSGSFFFGN